MDVNAILAELRKERDALDEAIRSLEGLASAHTRGPGRPRSFPPNGHNNGTKHAPQQAGNGEG